MAGLVMVRPECEGLVPVICDTFVGNGLSASRIGGLSLTAQDFEWLYPTLFQYPHVWEVQYDILRGESTVLMVSGDWELVKTLKGDYFTGTGLRGRFVTNPSFSVLHCADTLSRAEKELHYMQGLM